jgi:hypothetical protein
MPTIGVLVAMIVATSVPLCEMTLAFLALPRARAERGTIE